MPKMNFLGPRCRKLSSRKYLFIYYTENHTYKRTDAGSIILIHHGVMLWCIELVENLDKSCGNGIEKIPASLLLNWHTRTLASAT